MVEGLSSLRVATQLNECLSLDEQYLSITDLDAVNRVLGDLEVLRVLIALIDTLTIDGRVDRRVVVIGLAIFRVLDLDEVGFGQTLVVGLLSLPVVVEIIIGHLGVVLRIAIAVFAVLEWEGPRAVRLVVTLSINLVTVVGDRKQVLVGAALVALVVTTVELCVVGVELQQTTGDDLVGILHSLLQTTVGLRELRVGLTIGDSLYLSSRQRIVAPYEVGAGQQSLSSLF